MCRDGIENVSERERGIMIMTETLHLFCDLCILVFLVKLDCSLKDGVGVGVGYWLLAGFTVLFFSLSSF